MASAAIHKQELLLKDLATRAVTLYPANALVVRKIDVELKPGQNEIEIYGLSPTIDDSSIKFDGHGAATITDMTVNLVKNREKFADVYPDDSDPEDSEPEDHFDPEADDTELVKQLRVEVSQLTQKQTLIFHRINSIRDQVNILKAFHNQASADRIKPEEFLPHLRTYQAELVKLEEDSLKAEDERKNVGAELATKLRELKDADRESRRRERRELKEKNREKQKKNRKKQQELEKKSQAKKELLAFWPKKVYRVVVQLDTSVDTPGSSRRSSMTSATLVKGPEKDQSDTANFPRSVMLEFSYITCDAFWYPRYDITLSTETNKGSISYRAEYVNRTAETWKDTKLWFSTSHTQFGGLDEKVPWMHRWSIGLSKSGGEWSCTKSFEEESTPLQSNRQNNQAVGTINRNELFGADESVQTHPRRINYLDENESPQHQLRAQAAAHIQTTEQVARSQPQQGQQMYQMQPQQMRSMSMPKKSQRAPTSHTLGAAANNTDLDETTTEALLDVGPPIDHEDTSFEDHGLTTTYEVPGTRTLAPSSLTRRHKIATLPFSNLILTSIAVPKLRAAAFKRARLRNPSSSITLLRGLAGITLDGSYLGAQTLPRTSPGEMITLSLGVDPTVHISYAKPTVRRSTQGLVFNKAASQVYVREIVISNSRSVPIELMVLDQVPVSEDERLRVEVLTPKGLTGEDVRVRAGKAVMGRVVGGANLAAAPDAKKWGKAEAMMKKSGEVTYLVNLEKGSACSLPLEYEVRASSNDTVVNMS